MFLSIFPAKGQLHKISEAVAGRAYADRGRGGVQPLNMGPRVADAAYQG